MKNWRQELVNILSEVSRNENATDEERKEMIVQKIKGMLKKYSRVEAAKIILDITRSWIGNPIAEGCIRFLAEIISPPVSFAPGDYT